MSDEIDMRDASSVDEDDLNDEALEVISEFAVIVSLRLKTRIRRNLEITQTPIFHRSFVR